jgi:tetratricopeptide (TPR) repeat protein
MVLSPRRATVLTTSPGFRWRAIPGATRYRLTVSSATGELWNREVDADKLTADAGAITMPFPADVASLAPDTECLWKLEAMSDLATLRDESSVFRTAAKGAKETVDANLSRLAASAGGADTPAARFLAGSYLSGLGLYHDAADQFSALARLTPESPAAHEALGDVYSKVGLMDLAATEYQQALALGRAAP